MKHREHIFDIECDDLLPGLTKMHVVSWQERLDNCPKSSPDPEEFEKIFDCDLLIGHYIIGYDLDALEKLFGISPPKDVLIVDTLALSWYLDQGRPSYGLESYGETFGVPKPKIVDWKNGTYEEYEFRCERDVEINTRQWKRCRAKLVALYGTDKHGNLSPEALRLIRYVSYKLKSIVDASKQKIRIDRPNAVALRDKLTVLRDQKYDELEKAMPRHAITKEMFEPKKMYRAEPSGLYKKDGSLSSTGKKWFDSLAEDGGLTSVGKKWFALLEELHLPKTTKGKVSYIADWEDGNPGSHLQIKDWLYSLGWEPRTFKYTRQEDGTEKAIPQVRKEGELCSSVKELIELDPAIEHLDGLTVLNHRLGVVQGFLDCAKEEDGKYWVEMGVSGFTNTFRFKHVKPLANMPGVDKPYGAEIRGLIIAPDDEHELIGSDMVSLEDTTKRHYMQPIDPDYVAEMQVDGFDPHLNLAMFDGQCTQQDIDLYNQKVEEVVEKLKPMRKSYKATNYSATYGIGKAKLARDLKCSVSAAASLLEAFWKRNHAIKKVVSSVQTKTLKDDTLWLFNPVSGFWMPLRNHKDIFSTLNQSTGVFVFDTWLAHVVKQDIPVILQYHDEFLGYVKKGDRETQEAKVLKATEKLNSSLQLNVPIMSDTNFGDTYAECH